MCHVCVWVWGRGTFKEQLGVCTMLYVCGCVRYIVGVVICRCVCVCMYVHMCLCGSDIG